MSTLRQLHTPVATTRRIAFLTTTPSLSASLITAIADALRSVPGRRVAQIHSEEVTTRDAGNADIVLTDLASFTTLAEAAAVAQRNHVLCLVAGTDRAEADPALALAATLNEHHGVRTVVALCAPDPTGSRPRAQTRWARLIASKQPNRVMVVPAEPRQRTRRMRAMRGLGGHARRQLAVATLAGMLVAAASEAHTSTPGGSETRTQETEAHA